MTWDEFVKHVEEELKKLGKDGGIQIAYVNVAYPSEGAKLNVSLVEIGGDDELVVE